MNTDNFLQRLVRRALTKRQHFNADGTPKDSGVGVTGVVVTIVILGILAAVGGPPLFSLIFDAREFKLENNVQEAAQIVQQRLTLEPDWLGDTGVKPLTASTAAAGDAMSTDSLLVSFVEDAAYDWKNDAWALDGNDGDETIRVQFLKDDASGTAIAAGRDQDGSATADVNVPPHVDWISGDWRAVRLHARNSDGRWACALIVVQAEADGVQAGTAARYNDPASLPPGITATTNAASDEARNNSRLMNAWISGIWYDSGDVVTAGGGLHDCSPVSFAAAAEEASFPRSSDRWEIDDMTSTVTDPVRTFRRAL